MRRAAPAQLLSNAASTLESLPESLVLFGNPASGSFYGNGGVQLYLPQRALGEVAIPDRGIPRDELLGFVREAQQRERAFNGSVSAVLSFLPPSTEHYGVVRPGLFVHSGVGPQKLEELLQLALERIDPGAGGVCGLQAVSEALSRASPAGLFFGQPAGYPDLYGFWPMSWASAAPPQSEVDGVGRCILVARRPSLSESIDNGLRSQAEHPSEP